MIILITLIAAIFGWNICEAIYGEDERKVKQAKLIVATTTFSLLVINTIATLS